MGNSPRDTSPRAGSDGTVAQLQGASTSATLLEAYVGVRVSFLGAVSIELFSVSTRRLLSCRVACFAPFPPAGPSKSSLSAAPEAFASSRRRRSAAATSPEILLGRRLHAAPGPKLYAFVDGRLACSSNFLRRPSHCTVVCIPRACLALARFSL